MNKKPMQRKSAKYKMGFALKTIGGESSEALSREYKVGVAEIEKWKSQFLNGCLAYLNIRTDTSKEKNTSKPRPQLAEWRWKVFAAAP
ncbi:MAG: hypothetical protein OEV66_10410 [Spirochaetia bacterium]|nr:hypothetical protein [Spirochaetia bacterium]